MLQGRPVPIFRIFDVDKAIAFYVDFLGFREVSRHQFDADAPLYLILEKDEITLHLSEHHGDATPGASVRIASTDLDAYCAALLAKKYRYYRPSVTETPWHVREMPVMDPFRNRIVFYEASK